MSAHDLEKLDQLARALREASAKIDEAVTVGRTVLDPAEFRRLARQCGDVLASLVEISCDLYDVAPDLAPPIVTPEALEVDLTDAIAALASTEEDIRGRGIESLRPVAPDWLFEHVVNAPDAAAAHERAAAWWQGQSKPHVPVRVLHEGLRHRRRYYRWHSAKRLERYFGARIWDDSTGELDLKAADELLSAWNESPLRAGG